MSQKLNDFETRQKQKKHLRFEKSNTWQKCAILRFKVHWIIDPFNKKMSCFAYKNRTHKSEWDYDYIYQMQSRMLRLL